MSRMRIRNRAGLERIAAVLLSRRHDTRGALLFPLSTFDARALPPDSERRLVFQCGSGKRSTIAARARLAAGASRVAHLAGGIGAWIAAGMPVLRTPGS